MQQPRKIFKNGDLPSGCQTNDAWRRAFIPTYLRWVATQEYPWALNDEKALGAMQHAWDAIYDQKVQYTITLNDPVSSIVSQPIMYQNFVIHTTDHFCRPTNEAVTHGVMPTARPDFPSSTHYLMQTMNSTPTRRDKISPRILSRTWDLYTKISIRRYAIDELY